MLINVTMADAGRYTCIAKNSIGHELLSHWLFIKPRKLLISLTPHAIEDTQMYSACCFILQLRAHFLSIFQRACWATSVLLLAQPSVSLFWGASSHLFGFYDIEIELRTKSVWSFRNRTFKILYTRPSCQMLTTRLPTTTDQTNGSSTVNCELSIPYTVLMYEPAKVFGLITKQKLSNMSNTLRASIHVVK